MSRRRRIGALGAAAIVGASAVIGCRGAKPAASPEPGSLSPGSSAPTTRAPNLCPAFDDGVAVGRLDAPDLGEASGIAASRRNPGVWWVHNDSGNPADVFAIDGGGALLTRFHVAGAKNRDWEDIAVGPGPEDGVSYLYIGDIGDNAQKHSSLTILRVPEPQVSPSAHNVTARLDGAVALTARYPDGAHNAEALLVDPLSGEVLIVTKSPDGVSKVAIWPAPQTPGPTPHPLSYAATLTFGGPPLAGSAEVTGGDISPDGRLVMLRTYTNAYCWLRPEGAPVAAAFASPPTPMPLVLEPQGEAIGFSADGTAYRTTSEGSGATVSDYRRR